MTDDAKQVDTVSIESKNPKQLTLRLWPAVLIILAMLLIRLWSLTGEMAPSKFFFGLVVAPGLATILLNLWWLFGSGLRWADRLLVPFAFFLIAAATIVIAGKDFPAMALILYALPVVTCAWVGWLVFSFFLSWPIRRAGVLLVFLAIGAIYTMRRVDGMDGSFAANINWRWTPTPEAKLLLALKSQTPPKLQEATDAPQLVLQEGDWPCFRGPLRDCRLNGLRINTDWKKSPPKEMWRHRIGPGWSSCCVIGDRLFTQEQRGDDEFVVCYHALTGQELWGHKDATRFEEVVAGAGPRATPTFHEGRIYAMGANGKLNCLDAATGKFFWSSDIIKNSKAKIPQWGYSSSPLVHQGLVTVFAGGPESKAVVAYRADSGEFVWASGEGLQSYCSTQACTLAGVDQLLITTEAGLISFEPLSGAILWEHGWPVQQARVVQPAILNDTDVLLGTGMSGGTRRITVSHTVSSDGDKWATQELWTTKVIKPYYNDFVVNDDHLYGFDGNIFMCVSLSDGKLKWRARGYGNGQVLLLVDDSLLRIMSEQGEVALVEANPEKHQEIAIFKAIEGKTWNHPVIAHGKLYVRNAEEIACFELPQKENKQGENR